MALIVATQTNKTHSDPTAGLQAALTEFENALSDDQRRIFEASSSKPDVESATLLVANIAAGHQGTQGRHLWKRLSTFLQATQQFTSIVDTFISSNPTIAALVWGTVKTTLLAAGNAASYFDHVTSTIMEIGRLSPMFQQFGQLYTKHDGVQHALCNFYIVVIRFCTKIIMDTHRNAASHVLSTFFCYSQPDLRSFLDGLRNAAEETRDQVSLAAKQLAAETARLVQHESQESAKQRPLFKNLSSRIEKEQDVMRLYRDRQLQIYRQTMIDEIMDNLSTINHTKAWRLALQPRVPGTADWFVTEPSFQFWRSCNGSAVLCCTGAMGTGKTVFVSNIISYLLEERTDTTVICFHHCKSDHEVSLKSRGILGTLVRQMIGSRLNEADPDVLGDIRRESRLMECEDLIDFVLRWLKEGSTYFVIIDGLDECDAVEAICVKQEITKLCSEFGGRLKVLYSGRPELESLLFAGGPNHYKMSLKHDKLQRDLDQYVEARLDECLRDERLRLEDPALIVKISKTLKDGASGMFLWAKLFIDDLCSCLTDYEISQALEQPPRHMDQLFQNILTRIKRDRGSQFVKETLQCCVSVKRPLSIEEMREAVSISENQPKLDRSRMPIDMSKVVAACRGLVFFDDVDGTIHLVHHSVKTYLYEDTYYSQTRDFTYSGLTKTPSERTIGVKCLTYLHFDELQKSISRPRVTSALHIKPIDFGVAYLPPSSKLSGKIARRLLRQPESQQICLGDLTRKVEDILGIVEQKAQLSSYHFLRYAEVHWISHFKSSADIQALKYARLFDDAVKGKNPSAKLPWLQDDMGPFPISEEQQNIKALKWAVQHDNCLVFEILVSLGNFGNVNTATKSLILKQAVDSGQAGIVEILDRAGFNVYGVQFGCSLLAKAAEMNRLDIIDLMLKCGSRMDRWLSGSSSQRIIQSASKEGIELILQEMCYPSADSMELMRTAVDTDRVTIADYFVEQKLASASHELGLFSLLQIIDFFEAAVRQCRTGIISAFIAASSHIDCSNDGSTPSIATVRKEHLALAHALIAKGADVNQVANKNSLPIHYAIKCGRPEIIRVLIEAGASLNNLDEKGLSPLHLAVWGLHNPVRDEISTGIIHDLIHAGADVSLESSKGDSPLHLAVFRNSITAVQALIQAGVDVNQTNKAGISPLNLAIKRNEVEVARALIRADAWIRGMLDGDMKVLQFSSTRDRILDGARTGLAIEDSKWSSMLALLKEHRDDIFLEPGMI